MVLIDGLLKSLTDGAQIAHNVFYERHFYDSHKKWTPLKTLVCFALFPCLSPQNQKKNVFFFVLNNFFLFDWFFFVCLFVLNYFLILKTTPATMMYIRNQQPVTKNPIHTPVSSIDQPRDKMCRNVSVGSVCGWK